MCTAPHRSFGEFPPENPAIARFVEAGSAGVDLDSSALIHDAVAFDDLQGLPVTDSPPAFAESLASRVLDAAFELSPAAGRSDHVHHTVLRL